MIPKGARCDNPQTKETLTGPTIMIWILQKSPISMTKRCRVGPPEHGRQPLSWTYQSPCNVAWKPLPGFWPSEFIGGHHYIIVIAYVFFRCNYPIIRPIQTFQDHDQHAEVCGSRSMFHEICWTMWDLRHMSGLLVGVHCHCWSGGLLRLQIGML